MQLFRPWNNKISLISTFSVQGDFSSASQRHSVLNASNKPTGKGTDGSMQFRIWLPHVTTRLCLQPGRLWAPHLRGRWPPYESCWIAEHSSWALVIPPASSHQGFSDLTPQATNHFYATSLSLNWAQNPFKTFFWKISMRGLSYIGPTGLCLSYLSLTLTHEVERRDLCQ